ncbi:MAG: hypothetical protein M3490_08665 [Chloroflexota bacterium]|nr:hypothetical protein [Chloroflexota bacterium]
MTIITLAALVIAVVAGWGIGQLAGGGSGATGDSHTRVNRHGGIAHCPHYANTSDTDLRR